MKTFEELYFTLRDYVKSFKSELKYGFQQLVRGYSDPEWWNLNSSICEYIVPRIHHLREHHHGYPATLESEEQWVNILSDIEFWAAHYSDDGIMFTDDYDNYVQFCNKYHHDVEYTKDDFEQFKRGNKYFFEYFEDLWD